MTNADKIRSMTDEDLCDNFLMRGIFAVHSCGNCKSHTDLCHVESREAYEHCRNAKLDWLKQEVDT